MIAINMLIFVAAIGVSIAAIPWTSGASLYIPGIIINSFLSAGVIGLQSFMFYKAGQPTGVAKELVQLADRTPAENKKKENTLELLELTPLVPTKK